MRNEIKLSNYFTRLSYKSSITFFCIIIKLKYPVKIDSVANKSGMTFSAYLFQTSANLNMINRSFDENRPNHVDKLITHVRRKIRKFVG